MLKLLKRLLAMYGNLKILISNLQWKFKFYSSSVHCYGVQTIKVWNLKIWKIFGNQFGLNRHLINQNQNLLF